MQVRTHANNFVRWYGEGEIDLCSTCHKHHIVNAMPNTVRQLLLRIVEPEHDKHGTPMIVTVKEAYETM